MPAPSFFRSEFQINTNVTDLNQFDLSLTALPTGGFALGWTSNDNTDPSDEDIRFSIRNGFGNAFSSVTADQPFADVGTYDEVSPAVAVLADGRIAYVWEEVGAPGSAAGESDIFAAVLNADGTVFRPSFLLSTQSGVTNHDQFRPEVIGIPDGRFLVSWIDASSGTHVLRNVISNISGTNITEDHLVLADAATVSANNHPVMALMPNGDVVFTWSLGSAGNEQQHIAMKFATAASIDMHADVNPEDTVREGGVGGSGDVVALSNGNFVILFERNTEANDIQGRLFNADGVAVSGRFDISTGAGITPRGAALADGRFMVVYSNAGNIFGQMMFADGTRDGSQFTISNAAGVQIDPEIDTLADGRVVVSWRDSRGGDYDIFAEIYDPREGNQIITGSTFADDFYGTANSDAMYMGAGNDIASGEDGEDYIRGGAGIDNLHGGAGVDLLFGEGNADTLSGDDGDDFLYGGVGNDLLFGDSNNDVLYGDEDDDLLYGGLGADVLIGGTGIDDLRGGDGNDSFDGGTGNDTVYGGTGNDFMAGGEGNDTLIGDFDDDRIDGNAGNDSIDGVTGNDTVFAGTGNDFIQGGDGNDALLGESENDEINGGNNDDSIDGGSGNDTLRGDAGLDFIQGGTGDDALFGGADADDLRGGDNGDTLTGGAGGDTMYGGAGFDVFFFAPGSGVDVIVDFEDTIDRINLSGYAGATFANTTVAQSGANTLMTFVGGDQVTLLNFTATNLTAADFVF